MSAGESVGTCFGFEVRSALPFAYLREGGGDPLAVAAPSQPGPAEGDELVVEWTPTPELPFRARLYSGEALFRLWIDGAGWFVVDPEGPSVTLPEAANEVRREERLWGIPAILCFRRRGDMPIHAAAVEVDGDAILLCAPRTFGKTTLAAAFLQHGFRLLSEDVSCVRLNGGAAVIPGPAMLRLRPDVAERLELEGARPVGEPDDRVHLAVEPALRGDCTPVALRAIVFLVDADENVTLEPARPAEAIRDLFALGFRLPDDDDRARCFASAAGLADAVPAWNVSYPRRIETLPAVVDRIVSDAR